MYVSIVMGVALGLYGRQRHPRLGFGFAVGSSLLLAYALLNELILVVRGG